MSSKVATDILKANFDKCLSLVRAEKGINDKMDGLLRTLKDVFHATRQKIGLNIKSVSTEGNNPCERRALIDFCINDNSLGGYPVLFYH